MESKFEAVIDLEAQPFTTALQNAIAGLQALATELEKANSTLNQAAGGMDKSAAAADTMAGAAAGAAGALGQEAQAAKDAAAAHDKHAASAKKGADATAQASAENKRLRDGLMLGSVALRMGSSIAGQLGNEKVSGSLDMGASILNAFAMKAMMGPAGMAIGLGESVVKSFGYFDNLILGDDRKKGALTAQGIGDTARAEEIKTLIQEATKYNDILTIRKRLEKDLADADLSLRQAYAKDPFGENKYEAEAIARQKSLIVELLDSAKAKEPSVMLDDNRKSLSDFDAMRKEIVGSTDFALSLIDADSEKEKIAILEKRMKELRLEGESQFTVANNMKRYLSASETKDMLDRSAAAYGAADAIEIQLAEMRTGKKSGLDVPSAAYNAPQVDELWKKGQFLGDSIGGSGPAVDYSRRAAEAAEKTARNTDRMLTQAERGTTTGTWGN